METLERLKLDAMKELAYGASHEINNPLANISARAQTLLRDEKHPERRRALEAIHQQAMRAHEMISDLMLFARPPALQFAAFDAIEMIGDATEELADECDKRNIRLSVESADAVEVVGDRQQLSIALAAVLLNAMEAIGEDGDVAVVVELMDDTELDIRVADSGPGISEEVREHLFDPFFSGREAGRGLGFGLSKCWRIVTDHRGEVMVENGDDGGAVIVLRIPVDSRGA